MKNWKRFSILLLLFAVFLTGCQGQGQLQESKAEEESMAESESSEEPVPERTSSEIIPYILKMLSELEESDVNKECMLQTKRTLSQTLSAVHTIGTEYLTAKEDHELGVDFWGFNLDFAENGERWQVSFDCGVPEGLVRVSVENPLSDNRVGDGVECRFLIKNPKLYHLIRYDGWTDADQYDMEEEIYQKVQEDKAYQKVKEAIDLALKKAMKEAKGEKVNAKEAEVTVFKKWQTYHQEEDGSDIEIYDFDCALILANPKEVIYGMDPYGLPGSMRFDPWYHVRGVIPDKGLAVQYREGTVVGTAFLEIVGHNTNGLEEYALERLQKASETGNPLL